MERGADEAKEVDARAEEEALDRLLRGLGHPLRRRIMAALAEREGSAKTLSAELDARLQNVSYHLNRVLAEATIRRPSFASSSSSSVRPAAPD